MKKLIAVLCLSALFVLSAVPIPAKAGVIILWPNQFKLSSSSETVQFNEEQAIQNFHRLGAVGNVYAASFETEVRLPVGAIINQIAVNASSIFGNPAVVVSLARIKLGGDPDAVADLWLWEENPRDWYLLDIYSRRVLAGYKYYMTVDIGSQNGAVYGVRISYR